MRVKSLDNGAVRNESNKTANKYNNRADELYNQQKCEKVLVFLRHIGDKPSESVERVDLKERISDHETDEQEHRDEVEFLESFIVEESSERKVKMKKSED